MRLEEPPPEFEPLAINELSVLLPFAPDTLKVLKVPAPPGILYCNAIFYFIILFFTLFFYYCSIK
jgi:hypothetical protein